MDRTAGVGGDQFEKHRKTRPAEKFRFDVQLPFGCFQFSGYTDVLSPDFSIISGFFRVFRDLRLISFNPPGRYYTNNREQFAK